MTETKRDKMTYFAQILDAWDCELDILGPFNNAEDAEDAAWAKWNGNDNLYTVHIIKRLPAFQG
jgi:hypothetical protein